MRIRAHLLVTFTALTFIAGLGCGTPGAPMPPSLELPTPVDNLTATRKGNHVVLTWTASRRTTDKQNIRHSGVTRVCRVVDEISVTQCGNVIREITADQVAAPTNQQPNPKMVMEDTLPSALLLPTSFATYAVEMVNHRGKSAGLSNQRRVPLAPTLSAPTALAFSIDKDGVTLRWDPPAQMPASPDLRFHYRVVRRPKGSGAFVLVEDVPIEHGTQSVRDNSFQWEQAYEYKVVPITDVLEKGEQVANVEGDDSPVIVVVAHDVFPPAQVAGLQAVYSGVGQQPFIDLTWAPNNESDVAGYEIFRHEEGTQPQKISAEPAKSPSFRDDNVQPGHKYYYAVRAVDTRGNAGELSAESSESVPEH